MNSNCSPRDPGLIYILIPGLGICGVNQETHTLQGNTVNETPLLLFSYISEISFILRYRTELKVLVNSACNYPPGNDGCLICVQKRVGG